MYAKLTLVYWRPTPTTAILFPLSELPIICRDEMSGFLSTEVYQNGKNWKKGYPKVTGYYIYRRCPRRNVIDFGMAFLILKYANITQNTYIQS
jgi:hypothetical protein